MGESSMKTASPIVPMFFGLVVSAFIVGGALAEERVLEEELVIQDPTVARAKKLLVGGAVEYWYVSGPLTSTTTGERIGSIDGSMVGGSGYVGYDNLTLMISYKQGEFDSDLATSFREVVRDEYEIKLRYLFRDTCFPCLLVDNERVLGVVPYVMAGYNRTKLDSTLTVKTPGFVFVSSLSPNLFREFVYDSGLVGVGGILPFGNTGLGMRGDLSVWYTSTDRTIINPAPGVAREDSGTGIGGQAHLTGYWKIYKGLNVQVGAKYSSLNGGGVGTYNRLGLFSMLGYTHKF